MKFVVLNASASKPSSHNSAMFRKLYLFTSACRIVLNVIHLIITRTIKKINYAAEALLHGACTNLEGNIC
jgi:hypothetical protein